MKLTRPFEFEIHGIICDFTPWWAVVFFNELSGAQCPKYFLKITARMKYDPISSIWVGQELQGRALACKASR